MAGTISDLFAESIATSRAKAKKKRSKFFGDSKTTPFKQMGDVYEHIESVRGAGEEFKQKSMADLASKIRGWFGG